MFLLNQLFKFLKLLHSEVSTRQISLGFVLGMFLGFTPMLTLHWLGYWVILFFLRINIGAAFLGYAVFKILAFGLDPLFHKLGLLALTETSSLRSLWVNLSSMPVVPYTRFNNTIVMGSFLLAVLCSIPLYLVAQVLIRKYRETVVAKFKATTLFRMWQGSKLYSLYAKYEEFKS